MTVTSKNESYQLKSYTVGDTKISCVDRERAVDMFFHIVARNGGVFITVTSAHGIVESQSDEHLRRIINNAEMTLADGMPIVWVGMLKGAAAKRVTGAEFVKSVMNDPRTSGFRHYFYGGQPNTTSRVVARATELLGPDAIAGWHCPPFRKAGIIEDPVIVERIAETKPDIIWVGLSTPKQEYWMANHAKLFPRTLLVGVGAAFDFFAGVQSRAPKPVQKLGFEWLFRLMKEPRRLWPRYRRVVPGMLKVLFAEVMGRRYSNKGISSSCR
jgi:N-acetylglucosaminyldiphosphoundecaprenol N-acetyl-beta-D-mannosaminyltransferase